MLHTFVDVVQQKPSALTRFASVGLLLGLAPQVLNHHAPQNVETVTVKIRFLDGRNDKPMANKRVHFYEFRGDERKFWMGRTDKLGVFSLTVHIDSEITAGTDNSINCAVNAVANSENAEVAWIMKDGVVARDLCGKSSATVSPGELVVYFRPLTLKENLASG